MLEDSHGDYEWERLMEGVRMILPNAKVEDLRTTIRFFT